MLQVATNQSTTSPLFASQPWSGVSENYRFVSTEKIIDLATQAGFELHKTQIARVKRADKQGFQKHRLDFVHRDFKNNGDSMPVMTIINSHDRTSGVVISLGYYRLVCENGLMLGDAFGGTNFKVYHTGARDLELNILERIAAALQQLPTLISLRTQLESMELETDTQLNIAFRVMRAVAETQRKDSFSYIPLVRANRVQDVGNNAWLILNRIQENIIRGNYITSSGRKATKVTSIDTNLKLNKAIFDIVLEECGLVTKAVQNVA